MAQVADGAGGYSGTDWWNRTVPEMWRALAREEVTDSHHQVQSGWQATYNTIANHLERVKDYKAKLVAAWPPEKSPAAAAYVERLDALIDHLQDTYNAATTNHDAFKNAMLAVSSRRDELKSLYDQYVANQVKMAEFAAAKERLGNTGAADAMQPEVTPRHQQQLQYRAARIMVGLTSELSEATTLLTRPKPYLADVFRDDRAEVGEDVGFFVPPFAAATDTPSSRVGTSEVLTRPVSLENTDRPPFGRPHPGLTLDGAPPQTVPPGPTPTPQPPVNSPSGGAFNPSVPPGSRPGQAPVPGPGLTPPGRTRLDRSHLPKPQSPTSTGRPFPSNASNTGGISSRGGMGNVIGGLPSTPPQRGDTGRTQHRINPVGGVIGGAAGAGPRSGSTGMPVSGFGPLGGRPAPDREQSHEARRWDPDNPWETAEGVAPVLGPTEERRIDPGPAIGLDR